jgi:peroxidase/lariat debranching enzyme
METTKSVFLSIAVSYFCIFCYVSSVTASLSFDFYAASCPTVELIIRNTVSSSSSDDPSIPGKLLRMVFHDCFVEVSH